MLKDLPMSVRTRFPMVSKASAAAPGTLLLAAVLAGCHGSEATNTNVTALLLEGN